MEEYRKQLIKRKRTNYIIAFSCLISSVLLRLIKRSIIPITIPVHQIGTWTFDPIDWWGSIPFGLMFFYLRNAFQVNKILKNNDRLQEAYVLDNDERSTHISLLTNQTTLRIFLPVVWLMGVISSFIYPIVYLCLHGCILLYLIIDLIVASYYRKRF